MPESLIASVLDEAILRTYPKGQTILYPDDASPYLYLIKNGTVTMHDMDEAGNRKLLHIFGPPSLFPMVSFVSDMAEASWFYTTLTETQVYVLPYDKLKAYIESPAGTKAYNAILKQLLCEVHELLVRINSSTKTNSSIRLLAALKFLHSKHAAPCRASWCVVPFPVSHQLLAELTGLSRETVSITMKRLAADKIIRYPKVGRLELHEARLKKIKI